MKKTNLFLILTLAASPALLHAQTSYSDVVGYVKINLAAASDTIVAPQVFRPAELSASVSGLSSAGSQATLRLSGVSLTNNQFVYNSSTQRKTYFVLVTTGNLAGTYFMVASNTTDSIIVNLDGLTVASADITAIEVRPCWTLNTLFPASDANLSFTPSDNHSPGARRTAINLPNLTGTGVNRASSATYFFNNTNAVQDWVSTASHSVKAGDTAILPGAYLVLRNTGGTPVNLSLTQTGTVFARPLSFYLGTASKANDNYLALPRPTDYTLAQLGIDNTSFLASGSTHVSQRRDLLFVISPTGSNINRSAAATYFRYNNDWYSTAAASVVTNNAVIPAGSAIIVRKFSSDGNDRVWKNELNTSL
jgi:uncharacterized protein (TIGR02597 family)